MKRPTSADRRNFLKTGGAAAAGLLAGGVLPARASVATLPALPVNAKTQGAMPTRNLGKTG